MVSAWTLALAPTGPRDTVTVVEVTGDPQLRRRLATLGVRTGAHLSVLQRTSGGGRVVGVAGARIALDRNALRAIEVTHA